MFKVCIRSFRRFMRCLSLERCVPKCIKLMIFAICSLSQTPDTHFLDFAGSAFDSVLGGLEKGVWFIGLFCCCLVTVGITTVVVTFYYYAMPMLWMGNQAVFVFYMIYGHYLLVNIIFHYYMGVFTNPGTPPKVSGFDPYNSKLQKGWRVCYTCEQPKPPRAHHCRVCNRCVLKMDHHCPWIFNCVGHYNHRYFILFIVFMWLGTAFMCNCLWRRAFFYLNGERTTVPEILQGYGFDAVLQDQLLYPHRGNHEELLVLLVFFVCFAVTIALLLLGGWHIYLVTVAETSIEVQINRKSQKNRNLYNYGYIHNWKMFLGLVNGKSFVRHVLLPSRHKPIGDGMEWTDNKDKYWKQPIINDTV